MTPTLLPELADWLFPVDMQPDSASKQRSASAATASCLTSCEQIAYREVRSIQTRRQTWITFQGSA